MLRRIVVVTLILALAGSGAGLPVDAMQQGGDGITPAALEQITALLAEKDARTPTEQKVDSNLLYAFKQQSGVQLSAADAALQTGVTVDAKQLTVVDITAHVTVGLLAQLDAIGAKVMAPFPEYRSIRAAVPISQVLTIAGWSEVIFIQPKQEAQTTGEPHPVASSAGTDSAAADMLAAVSPQIRSTLRPDFAARAQRVQSQLRAALEGPPVKAQVGTLASVLPAAITQGITQTFPSNRSEGDVAHRADLARQTYGYIGTGVKVCVLSDGVNSLAALQASGDLPAVTVVPGQAGNGNEGAAMLEIVYDLAPGAQLFYATAFAGIASFAANIKTLRNTYHCDILVDDVAYFVETPFQLGQAASVVSTSNGGIVTQAVNEVVADGALYFSSAGNSGNQDDGTSGVWEGDFADGGAVAPPVAGSGKLLDFDTSVSVQAFNTATAGSSAPVTLFWSDPLGGSSNDYDLFLLNSTGASVLSASTNVQNGTQDPLERSGITPSAGNRIVVVQRTGAANRYLHVNTNRGQLQFNTPGQTGGHAAALNAFGVAAADAQKPPVLFGGSTVVETFSSDGPRRHFYKPDSTPITPENFSSTGGALAQKPDLTAADGVSCAAPGFDPFLGTSAAAPHAAAIAALLRSAKPTMTVAEARTILTSAPGAIDIEAPGVDRDSGAGVLNALAAMQTLNPTPVPLLAFNGVTVKEGARKNGNGVVEPGESFYMTVPLTNTTLATATNVLVSLELLNGPAGAGIIQPGPLNYGTLAAHSSFSNTATPFIVSLSPSVLCGTTLNFKNTATYGGGGSNSPLVAFSSVSIGSPFVITTTLDSTAPPPFAGPPAYTTATGTQTGRLTRSGNASACNSATSNPGLFTTTGARQYDSFTITNTSASSVCVSVKLSTPQNGGASALFAVVYDHNGFIPATPTANYLADPGNSPNTTSPVSFSFLAPAGQQFTVVVHEVNPGAGVGTGLGAYSLELSGIGFRICAAAPQPPASITATAGNGQSAPLNEMFLTPLQVTVRDAADSPVPEVQVVFTAPTSGTSASFPDGNSAITDADGQANRRVAANALLGQYTITANTTNPALATAATFTLTNTNILTYLPLIIK